MCPMEDFFLAQDAYCLVVHVTFLAAIFLALSAVIGTMNLKKVDFIAAVSVADTE